MNVHPKNIRLDIALSYAFAGAATIGLVRYLDPPTLSGLLKDAGWLEYGASTFTLGAFVHLLYRKFLGELVFFPAQMLLHEWFKGQNSSRGYFKSIHVEGRQARAAYIETRQYIRDSGKGVEDIIRGELHIFYVAAVLWSATALYAWYTQTATGYWFFAVAAAITFVGALYADSKQHEHEVRQFRKINADGGITENLKLLGLIKVRTAAL